MKAFQTGCCLAERLRRCLFRRNETMIAISTGQREAVLTLSTDLQQRRCFLAVAERFCSVFLVQQVDTQLEQGNKDTGNGSITSSNKQKYCVGSRCYAGMDGMVWCAYSIDRGYSRPEPVTWMAHITPNKEHCWLDRCGFGGQLWLWV